MKRSTKTPKAAVTLALAWACAQVLLVGCATTSDTSSTANEDEARLAKAEKQVSRFENLPRTSLGR
ncbi:MAG: hypothetical protein AAB250_02935 [Bdellovibrionota bacterium]